VRRLMQRAAVVAGAVGLPLAVGLPAADASDYNSSFSVQHRFLDFNGQPHTCQVVGGSALFNEDPPGTFHAHAGTAIKETADPACQALLNLDLTFLDPSGEEVHAGASAGGLVDETYYGAYHVDWDQDGTGPHLVVGHRVFFTQCSSNCQVNVPTSPK
jgi:hypothetical protein